MWNEVNLARAIGNTDVRPDITRLKMRAFCEEAGELGFRSVCITPVWVELASRILKGTSTAVSPVVGLFGETMVIQVAAIREAVSLGADEFDLFVPLHEILDGNWSKVQVVFSDLVDAAEDRPIKMILENNLLSEDQIIRTCHLCVETGISCVKTATGIFAGGAKLNDVKLMVDAVNGMIEVKASGGIRTFEQAEAFLAAGASRVGSSTGVSIIAGAPD